jgi:hypothetical protein
MQLECYDNKMVNAWLVTSVSIPRDSEGKKHQAKKIYLAIFY